MRLHSSFVVFKLSEHVLLVPMGCSAADFPTDTFLPKSKMKNVANYDTYSDILLLVSIYLIPVGLSGAYLFNTI